MSDFEFRGEFHPHPLDVPPKAPIVHFDGRGYGTPNTCGTCGRDFAEVPSYHVRAKVIGSVVQTVAWHTNCLEPEM